MEFKDYYAALGVARSADAEEIKRAYRKLARKYHPDVSKEPAAEDKFKEVAEAYEALKDPERRAAYDAAGEQWKQRGSGQSGAGRAAGSGAGGFGAEGFGPGGFEFSGAGFDAESSAQHSEFFEALFGRRAGAGAARSAGQRQPRQGTDHHARVRIDLLDAYRGGERSISLSAPTPTADGRIEMREREVRLQIPKGIRPGQQLRLVGQGGPGLGEGAPAGDLYLEIEFAPHSIFRVDGADVHFDLPLAPWEAALGAKVQAPTPEAQVELQIPPGTPAGRQLRLRGKGLPGAKASGDLFAHIQIVLPPAGTPQTEEAWRALAQAAAFNPRAGLGL